MKETAEERLARAMRDAERIIDLYTSGVVLSKIQEIFNLNRKEVRYILDDVYGIPRRERLKTQPMYCQLPDEASACYYGDCHTCGWNPAVMAKRKEALRHG